jgi:acetyl esterase/lipase
MQVGELRLPVTASPQLFPVVIVVHGGCWVSSLADYHFMDNFSNAITDLGYATWNIEYRAIGTGGEWPVMFQDLNKAVDYVRTLGQTYPLDLNKVIVIGHSAGGHIALWIASRGKLKPESVLYTENPLMIRGAISLAGIANVTATNTACGNEAINIIGANTVTRLGETSPLHMLPIGVRTILMSGRSDNIVPSSIGIEYNRKAMELGDDSKHYDLEGMTHFDLIDPARTDWVLYQSAMKALLGE